MSLLDIKLIHITWVYQMDIYIYFIYIYIYIHTQINQVDKDQNRINILAMLNTKTLPFSYQYLVEFVK